MLELCKGERGEKVVTKASHMREKKRYSWNFSKQFSEKRKEIKASLELFQKGKMKEDAQGGNNGQQFSTKLGWYQIKV